MVNRDKGTTEVGLVIAQRRGDDRLKEVVASEMERYKQQDLSMDSLCR